MLFAKKGRHPIGIAYRAPNLFVDIRGRKESTMRAASPLIVLLVVFSWALPAHAGAQTPIPGVDRWSARP